MNINVAKLELKVGILAGGKGLRLRQSPSDLPKPLVEVGGTPVLSHVMQIFRAHGLDDITVALGHHGSEIRTHYEVPLLADVLANGDGEATAPAEWTPKFLETGLDTQTGGRIKRLAQHFDGQAFLLTWCDCVADIDLSRLIAFHRGHGKLATVTAVRPPPRYGHLSLDNDRVTSFKEKPQGAEGWINGGFFMLEPEIAGWIKSDDESFEYGALEKLARSGELMAYRHEGFWAAVDTLWDKARAEDNWRNGNWPVIRNGL